MSRVMAEGSRVAALVRDNGVEAESCDASRAFSLALDGLPQLGTHQPVGDDAPDSLQFRSFVNSFAPSRKQPRQATKNLRVEIALGVQRLLRKAGHPKFGSINSTVSCTGHQPQRTDNPLLQLEHGLHKPMDSIVGTRILQSPSNRYSRRRQIGLASSSIHPSISSSFRRISHHGSTYS